MKIVAKVFLFCLSFPELLYSLPILKLQDSQEIYDLDPYLSFYKDSAGKIQIAEIIQRDKTGEIFIDKHKSPEFGITSANVWGKFTWENESSKRNDWLLVFDSERLEEVNIFIVSSGKILSQHHYDYHMPFSKRLIRHRKLIFPLANPGQSQTIYFNGKSQQILELTSAVATPLALSEKNYMDMLEIGLYYGIMLSMIIYNSFIFFSVRDRTYLYYIVYIFFYLIGQSSVDGLLHQFIFSQNFEFAPRLKIFAASITITSAGLFAVSLLKIKNDYPKIYILYLFLIFLSILPSIALLTIGPRIAGLLLAFAVLWICASQIIVSFFLSFKIKLARYHFAAWLILLSGLVIHQLKSINIYIPFFSKSNYAIQFGSATEALILSLALGYRINVMRQSIMEKDKELLNAKFTNLKDKMNPHFVLNTLSIIMSYLKRDVNKANAALNYFTSAYKYLIGHENEHLIYLNKEIEFTKDYTNILLIKFSDTLEVKYDISGNLDKVLIPFLSLQPIVENAFKHGIRKIEKGEIHIKISIKGMNVVIEVRNTSCGAAIKNPLKGTLGAIKRRLEHFFEDADLTIHDDGKATIVKVHYTNQTRAENLIANHTQ